MLSTAWMTVSSRASPRSNCVAVSTNGPDAGDRSTATSTFSNAEPSPVSSPDTTRVGRFVRRSTRSATDGRRNRAQPVRRSVPMTIRSTGRASACSTMISAGSPCCSAIRTFTPAASARSRRSVERWSRSAARNENRRFEGTAWSKVQLRARSLRERQCALEGPVRAVPGIQCDENAIVNHCLASGLSREQIGDPRARRVNHSKSVRYGAGPRTEPFQIETSFLVEMPRQGCSATHPLQRRLSGIILGRFVTR